MTKTKLKAAHKATVKKHRAAHRKVHSEARDEVRNTTADQAEADALMALIFGPAGDPTGLLGDDADADLENIFWGDDGDDTI